MFQKVLMATSPSNLSPLADRAWLDQSQVSSLAYFFSASVPSSRIVVQTCVLFANTQPRFAPLFIVVVFGPDMSNTIGWGIGIG